MRIDIPAVLKHYEKSRSFEGFPGATKVSNAQLLERKKIGAYIATKRQKHRTRLAPAPRGRPPKDLTARDRMARKLRTVLVVLSIAVGVFAALMGAATNVWQVFACRALMGVFAGVEPVIGQIKHARGFRQFLRRGLRNVGEEWALVCTAHNLLKLFVAGATP